MAKISKTDKKAVKQSKASQPKKKSRIKETFSELKKVSWPTFGKTIKQTGMVLSVVLIFGILVLGLDLLISYLLKLITSI